MKTPEGGCPGYTIVEIDDVYLSRVFSARADTPLFWMRRMDESTTWRS